jgi:hypothetical protein
VSVWFVRAALAYLVLGVTLGALLLWNVGLPFRDDLWRLGPAHVEFLLVGWTAQLTLGVALWIFPRLRLGSLPQGRVGLAWAGWGLLNAGIWLVATGRMTGGAMLAASGRALELAAVLVCAANLWGRVRPGLSQM